MKLKHNRPGERAAGEERNNKLTDIMSISKNMIVYNRAMERPDHDQNIPVDGELIPPMTRIQYSRRRYGYQRGWTVKVKCPWCGKYHFHSWEGNDRRPQTRVSHCKVPGVQFAGYTIYPNTQYRGGK